MSNKRRNKGKNPLQKTLVFAERAKALMLSVSRLSNAFLTKVVI